MSGSYKNKEQIEIIEGTSNSMRFVVNTQINCTSESNTYSLKKVIIGLIILILYSGVMGAV
jgi:hypothetical protein